MKAQRDVAEESGKEGAVPASFSAADCLRISVTFKPPSKNADIHDAFATKER
jgi:hypothetical protein